MMNKSRYQQRRIIIMDHMESNLAWQKDSTLSSSEYFNVLKQIDLFAKTCCSEQSVCTQMHERKEL